MHGTTGRLESLARILGGDTASSGVALGLRTTLGLEALFLGEVEVNFGGGIGVDTVKKTNVTNAVQGNTHGNLELGSGQVDSRNHLGCGMLDLQTRIQFEEVEFVVGVRVEVLDGTSRNVSDQPTEAHSSALHGLESGLFSNSHGGLLDNLLVTTLDGAITTEEGNVVAVLISQQLHLEMASVTSQLHNEDRRSRNLVGGGVVQGVELFLVLDLSNTLTTTTFGGLDHDRETDFLGLRQTLFWGKGAALFIDLILDCHDTIFIELHGVDTGSRPRNTRHTGVLCNNGRRDLVT